MVTLNSKTQEISRSGQYWAMSHYSKLIRRGARVIASTGDLTNVDHVAVQNPDGGFALVLTNRGDQQQVRCQLAGQALDLTLDAGSVTTVTW